MAPTGGAGVRAGTLLLALQRPMHGGFLGADRNVASTASFDRGAARAQRNVGYHRLLCRKQPVR